MFKRFCIFITAGSFFLACSGGFEKFAPPTNSISGRGAKQNPKILTTTPAENGTVSPVTGTQGTRIVVVFDMTMNTGITPVVNTYVRDDLSSTGWYTVDNSGATFTWSSTNYLNDTLTIQLGWVRWPENNQIAFDFDNSKLINLDDMPLANDKKISFFVGWEPGRYPVVHTGQYECFRYNPTPATGGPRWENTGVCSEADPNGTVNYPYSQNGPIDPRNSNSSYYPNGFTAGRRFPDNEPANMNPATCNGGVNDACYPYAVDSVTTLIWKTCHQGQRFNDVHDDRCTTDGNDYTWGQAVNACSALNNADNGQGYGGRKDWRLPTAQELEGITDFGAYQKCDAAQYPLVFGYKDTLPCDGGVTNRGQFPNTSKDKGYWTATGLAGIALGSYLAANAYVVDFMSGGASALRPSGGSARGTSNRLKVRCVAGPSVAPPVQNFVPSVQAANTPVTINSVPFTGYPGPAFSVAGVVSELRSVNYIVTLQITGLPSSAPTLSPAFDTQAPTISNYCIQLAGTAPPSPSCLSAANVDKAVGTVSGTNATVRLNLSGVTPGTLYTVYVLNNFTTTAAPITLNPNRWTFRAHNNSSVDLLSVVTTSPTTLQVRLSKIPNSAAATTAGNYCISINSGFCTGELGGVASATLSGRTVTLTTNAAQTSGTSYYVFADNLTFLGNHVVTDSANKLMWQRCRYGLSDNPTCTDDGDPDNDEVTWNDGLNYCHALNAASYAGFPTGWRAPTINELLSISNRNLFMSQAAAIDQTIFPLGQQTDALDIYISSTSKVVNGDPGTTSVSSAWGYAFRADSLFPIAKTHSGDNNPNPDKRKLRCVRSIP